MLLATTYYSKNKKNDKLFFSILVYFVFFLKKNDYLHIIMHSSPFLSSQRNAVIPHSLSQVKNLKLPLQFV